MSIYRKFDRSDVRPNATTKGNVTPLRRAAHIDVGLEEHKHLRKATPADIPLRRTLTWIESLPRDVRPTALVRRFARIANLIAGTWGDPKSFDTYMESLLTDQRGNRQGFPAEILAELVALQRYHDTAKNENLAWDAVGKRGGPS